MSKIKDIVERYFFGNHSKKSQNAFISWVSGNKEMDKIDDALEELWRAIEVAPDHSTEESYQKISKKIDTLEENSRRYSRTIFTRRVGRVAVAVVVPLLFGALSFMVIKQVRLLNIAKSIEFVECFVPNGEIKTIVLPDSSEVYLNSGSVLIYPSAFIGDRREVFLNGEASFDVKSAKNRVFKVKTTDVDIEVMGTIFNVSAYINEQNSKITLESGRVNVVLKNSGGKSISLNPNEQLRYSRDSGDVELRQVDASNVLAWNRGHLIIQSVTIVDIAKLIERKYGIDVFLNSNKYQDEIITAKFIRDENLEEFMEVIRQLIPEFKYKIEENKMYIY